MSVFSGPEIVNNGLVLQVDSGNVRSYPGSGTSVYSLIYGSDVGTMSFVSYDASNKGCLLWGTNASIEMTNSSWLQITGEITLSAWVNPSSLNFGNVMSKNYNSGWRYRIQSDGTLWFYVNGNSVSGGSVTVGSWNHLLVTGNSGGLSAYVNGVSVASNATAFVPGDAATGNLILGAGSNSGLAPLPTGTYATLFSVYNRALSAAEISQNFEASRYRFGI